MILLDVLGHSGTNWITLLILWIGIEVTFSFFISVPLIISQSYKSVNITVPAIFPSLRHFPSFYNSNRLLFFQSRSSRQKGSLFAMIFGLSTLILTGLLLHLLSSSSFFSEYIFNFSTEFYYVEFLIPFGFLIWAILFYEEKRSSYADHDLRFCIMCLNILIPLCKPKDLIIMEREIKKAAKIVNDSSIYNAAQWEAVVKKSLDESIKALYRSSLTNETRKPEHFVLSRINHFHKMMKEDERNLLLKDFYRIRANWAVQIFCFHLAQNVDSKGREKVLKYILHYRILQGWITKEQAKKEYDNMPNRIYPYDSNDDGPLWDIDVYWEEKVPIMR